MGTMALIQAFAVSLCVPAQAPRSGGPGVDWYAADRPLSETLAKLAKASGQDPEVFRVYRREDIGAAFSDKGRVTTIHAGDATYAIAVQEAGDGVIPGISGQQIVLLTPQGRILDRIQCDAPYGLGMGNTETTILRRPDRDGAQIVVRYVGERAFPQAQWWPGSHSVTFRGRTYTFTDHRPTRHPVVWDRQGLLRVEVADGKLGVLFPRLDSPEEGPGRSQPGASHDGTPPSGVGPASPPPPRPSTQRETGVAHGDHVVPPFQAGSGPKRPVPPPDWTATGSVLSRSLADLARRQGHEPGKYDRSRDVSAEKIASGNATYVLTLEHGEESLSHNSVVQATIWSVEGKLLDQVRCEVDHDYGVLRWDDNRVYLTGPGASGRGLTEPPYGWHFWHTVVREGRRYTFWSEEGRFEHPINEVPTILRTEIQRGRFVVSSPRLESPQDEFRNAEALRIGYAVGPDVKSIRVDNPAELKDIVSTMAVQGMDVNLSVAAPANATVNFLMPNGASIRTTFVTPTTLDRAHWGQIHLASSAFHDKIAAIISKAEGKEVRLIDP